MYGVSQVPVALMIPRRDVAPIGFDPEALAAITHDDHFDRPVHGEGECLLVGRIILRHRDAGLHFCGIGIDHLGKAHPRQIVDTVDGAQFE